MLDNEGLGRVGLYLDEMTRKLRVLHPNDHQFTNDIITECDEYRRCTHGFRRRMEEIIANIDRLSRAAERAQLDTVGKRGYVMAIGWQRDIDIHRINQDISEDKSILERMEVEHEILLRIEEEMKDKCVRLSNK